MEPQDDPAGFHVTNPYFAALLHAVHAVLDPLCAATVGFDEEHGWAPCSAAKLLVLVAVHVAVFMLLQFFKSRQPFVAKKSVIELANECLDAGPAAGGASGSSSAVRAPDQSGLQRRK